jgi:hypothetical protein
MPVFDLLVAEYRYFVVDFLSNAVIAELPFKGVKYGRSLNAAGSFNGTIPIIDKTTAYNLYENTMPGKTALYVVRNDECVWGGVIWSRSYSLESRELAVTATEFTSYLYHRNTWKTFSNSYSATANVVTAGTMFITLTNNSYAFALGMPVSVKFSTNATKIYDGVRTISGPPPTGTTFSVSGVTDSSGNPIPIGAYSGITVTVRVDTYDFIRSLITNALSDFIDIQFPNFEIEPGVSTTKTVTNKALTDNYATLTAAAHGVLPGQGIVVRNVGAPFDGEYEVTSTTANTLTYFRANTNIASTAISPVVFTNTQIVAHSASVPEGVGGILSGLYGSAVGYASIWLNTAHGLSVGDYVTVVGLDDPAGAKPIFNGVNKVTSVDNVNNSFSYVAQSSTPSQVAWYIFSSAPVGSSVTSTPTVTYGTYGPFPANADFDLDFSTNGYSGEEHLADNDIRGYELKSVGEILEEYTDSLNGFEYRIDCAYDTATSSFTREFVFIPLDPIADYKPLDPGEVPSITWYGAENYVFEYPGNIMQISFDESAENAATRFFVLGSDNNLGNDASQPYSVATATDMLEEGWPLLDADESKSGIFDEAELYDHAKRYLSEFRPPVADMSVTVNGSLTPTINTYKPGDWCVLIIDDDFVKYRLASNLEPRSDILLRKIEGFDVTVPDNPSFPEQVQLTLIHEWEIDKVGE